MADAGAELPRLLPEPRRLERRPGWCGAEVLAREPLTETDPALGPEAYRLEAGASGTKIAASGELGFFRARQTLSQLRMSSAGKGIPALAIEDEPALPVRGVLLDISRGRVPRRARLERAIRRLAALKINHLQLYFEHPFRFAFDGDIAGEDAYSPDDLRALDALCRELHIDFVPCFTCFGHLGKILSLPRYRALAEAEFPASDWAHATFLQRLRGATVNPEAPGTRALFEAILSEFLPCFSSPNFNLCGDETYDLGAHLGPETPGQALASLYARHVRTIQEIAEKHGKTVWLWGDMLHKHSEAISQLPPEATILDWAYFPSNDFTRCRLFAESGRRFLTCPSTRGFGMVFNRISEAAEVIRRQTDAALRFGAVGLLNTDWGDFGHFNMPASSLYPLALGAAQAWNPDTSESAFDEAFSAFFHPAGLAKEAGAFPLRLVASPFAPVHPRLAPEAQQPLPAGVAAEAALRAEKIATAFAESEPTEYCDRAELDALALEARTIRWNALREAGTTSSSALQADFDALEKAYAPLWFEESMPRGLLDIHARIFQPMRELLMQPS